MPTNHTSNYQLSQWVRSDQVKMEDFNEDNAKIDGALSTLAGQVAAKASQAALEAEVTARTAAVSSINTALTKRGNCRVEAFTYTGNGTYDSPEYTRKSFGFSGKPTFFMVIGIHTALFCSGPGTPVYCIYTTSQAANGQLSSTWSGNTITITGDERAIPNQNGFIYQVVVFYSQDA